MKNTGMKQLAHNRGLVKTIILIVVALLILSYFGLNLRNIVNSPTGQANFSFARDVVVNTWNNYLKVPATYLWNIFVVYLWNPFLGNMEKINTGQPNDIQASAPTIPLPAAVSNQATMP